MAVLPAGQQLSVKYTFTGPDGTIATFNEPSDPNYVGSITEITGLDSPEVRENAENLTGMDGGIHGNFYDGRRPITISGTILNVVSNEDRNKKITKLTQASNALREDAILEWTPDGGEAQFVKVRRQQALRISGAWVKTFQLSLVAADPRIYSSKLETTSVQSNATEAIITTARPLGLALDATHVYWANTAKKCIGRSNLSGTSVETEWLKLTTATPKDVAVDAAHVYWTDSTNKSVGRATIAGATIEETWVKLGSAAAGLAVDAAHIYWGNPTLRTVGRATIAGATIEEKFIETFSTQGIAIDAGHIYWGSPISESIGRAAIGGGSVELQWIKKAQLLNVTSVAVSATSIYWASENNSEIGSALINGTEAGKLYMYPNSPTAIAVFSSEFPVLYISSKTGIGGTGLAPTSVVNKGSTTTFPVYTLLGSPLKAFSITAPALNEQIAINFQFSTPVVYKTGLAASAKFMSNSGENFYLPTNFNKYQVNLEKITVAGLNYSRYTELISSAFLTILGFAVLPVAEETTFTAILSEVTGKYYIFRNIIPGYVVEQPLFIESASPMFSLGASSTKLYFGVGANLQQSAVTGTPTPTTLITGANVAEGTMILVEGAKIYWINTTGEIKSATTAGTEVKTVVSGTKATSLSISAGFLYWTNTSLGTIGRSEVSGSKVEPEWASAQGEPVGVYAQGSRAYWYTSSNGNLVYKNVESGSHMEIVIDTLNRTVVGRPEGEPRSTPMQSFYGSVDFPNTNWFGLAPGSNPVATIATEGKNAPSTNVSWRNAWI